MNPLRNAAVTVALAACSILVAAAEPLPAEAFAAPPRVAQAALSPDGRWFAAIMHQGDANLAVTHSVAGHEPPTVALRNEELESRLNWVRFVRDDRLVISVSYLNRRGWNQLVETRLVAVDRDGGHMTALVEPTRWQRNELVAQYQDRVIDWLPGDGHHLLLQAQGERGDPGLAVFEVDVDTGRRTRVHNVSSRVQNWITDASHRPRVSVAQKGTDVAVQVCDPDGEHWRTAWTYAVFSRDVVRPLGFGADPNLLYVTADADGRRAVYEVDLRDPALPRRPMLADPQGDAYGFLLVDPASHRALGLSGNQFGQDGGASSAGRFWDPDAKALVAAIDAALPGQSNRLLQFSADGSHYLVYTSGNGVPGRFMLGDRRTGKLDELAAQYPGLPADRLVRKTALTIRARDGLELPALLALPAVSAGRTATNLPTVILPNGNPVGSDSLDFDPWVEFLTDRGYAVLQVAFRGSAGYGNGLRDAGLKRWGLEMQDDLSDSLKWLVDRGTADPSRVCIVGGGYGGYAALMGGAKTPGLYRCVVAIGGVSDLIDLGNDRAHFVNGKAVFESLVGSPWDDRAQLKETSPRHLAAQFRAPVLLIHGTADVQVPYAQSEDMADALTSAGKDVRLVTQQDGDHPLSHAAYRIEAFRELDAFLGRYLAPTQAVAAIAGSPPAPESQPDPAANPRP